MIRRIRLGFVVVICVVLQTTLFTHLRVDGVAPDVGLVAVLAVAYYDGAESGAWFGFVMGLSIDLFLTTPLGLSALAYAITGYAVGVFQAGMVRRPPLIAPLLGGIGGFFGGRSHSTVISAHKKVNAWLSSGEPLQLGFGRCRFDEAMRKVEETLLGAAG